METSSLKKNRPRLESVLGPLSAGDEAEVRAILDEVDGILIEIARHFHRDGAGWEGTGLELTWMASGQVAISSNISVCSDGGQYVEFCVELRPSWYYGDYSSTLTWEVETEIQADCQDVVDHSTVELVHENSVRAATALEAAAALRIAVRELLRLAEVFPLEHWLKLTVKH